VIDFVWRHQDGLMTVGLLIEMTILTAWVVLSDWGSE
jgi:hypothetical protein